MTNPKDWTEPTIPGFTNPSLPSTPGPNPLSANHGTGALPTAQETEAACKSLTTNIEEALRNCQQIADYRIANRELSLTKTKLEEALMWLERSAFYVPAD